MEFVQGPTLFSYLPQIQMDKECLRVKVDAIEDPAPLM
jgi:hypothetical protein